MKRFSLFLLFFISITCLVPSLATETNTIDQSELIKLLESKIDLSKPANRGEQIFDYLLDENGKQVANITGLKIKSFSEGLAPFESEMKMNYGGIIMPGFGQTESGFIDTAGNKVIPAEYLQCGKFSEGLAWVYTKSQELSYIDPSGKIVFTVKDKCRGLDFSEGQAQIVTLTAGTRPDGQEISALGKWGYIDKAGKVTIEPKYDSSNAFSQKKAAVKLNGKWFFIDSDGKQVSDTYDKVSSYAESLAAVRTNFKWGYIDLANKLVIPYSFDDAQSFSEGLAAVKMGNLVGFINKVGKIVIQPKYKDTLPFSQGLCGVQIDSKKWGYIDKTGNMVVEPQFDQIDSFACNRALVKKGVMYGFIDLQGKYVVEPKFVFAQSYSANRAAVADKNWNHPVMRGMLMGVHLEGLKEHKDSKSPSGIYIPVNFEDALRELDNILPPAAKHDIQIITKDEMIHYHHGFGTWMRNNWRLWAGSVLSKDMQKRGFTHPDDMSGAIFDSYWLKVHGKPIDLKSEAEHYEKYWQGMKNMGKKNVKIPSGKLPRPK